MTWRDVESASFTTTTNAMHLLQGANVGALVTNRHGLRNARSKTAARVLNAQASLEAIVLFCRHDYNIISVICCVILKLG